MIFNDERNNVARVARLGVTSVLVSTETRISVDMLRPGLLAFAAREG